MMILKSFGENAYEGEKVGVSQLEFLLTSVAITEKRSGGRYP
jgi:hypothetical protein